MKWKSFRLLPVEAAIITAPVIYRDSVPVVPRRAECSFDCGSMLLFRTTPDNICPLENIADGADK